MGDLPDGTGGGQRMFGLSALDSQYVYVCVYGVCVYGVLITHNEKKIRNVTSKVSPKSLIHLASLQRTSFCEENMFVGSFPCSPEPGM